MMSVYDVTLTTLYPIHIGDGKELRNEFDFVTDGSLTYRLNVDRILEEKMKDPGTDQKRYPLPGNLLEKSEYQRYARYIVRGAPRSRRSDARMKSFIKDIYDRPYIPGSSLKGALRTGLGWSILEDLDPNFKRKHFDWGGGKKAGRMIENQIFRKNPKGDPAKDLLRALQISDMTGLEKPGEGLMIANVQVITKSDKGSPIELEALKDGIVLKGTIKIEDELFGDWTGGKLGFKDRKHWLDELMPRVHGFTLNRVRPLLQWFSNAGVSNIVKFYRDILNFDISKNQAILQVGWGGGWDSKTFGSHLKKNETLFKNLLKRYGMRKGKGPVRDFPVSKRVVNKQVEGEYIPFAPLGWVLMEMKERA